MRNTDEQETDAPLRSSAFSSRLLMDVVAAQLPSSGNVPQAAADLDNEAGASAELPSPNHGASTPPSASGGERGARRGLSLAALVKAERALDKPVAISSGGSHVSFSRDDVRRIRDPQVLRFMEENSSLFARYAEDRPPERTASAGDTHPSTAPERTTAARVESDILSLQKEIETFITAVDEEGRNYRILTNEAGDVVVPVEDDTVDGEGGVLGELALLEDGVSTGTSFSQMPQASQEIEEVLDEGLGSLAEEWQRLRSLDETEDDNVVPAASDLPVDQAEGTPSTRAASVKEPAPEVKAPPKPKPRQGRARPKVAGRSVASRERVAFVPSSALAATAGQVQKGRGGQKRQTAGGAGTTRQAPAVPVRPVRALRPEEEERVEALLHKDFALAGPSPYAMPEDAVQRVKAIDERLSALRVARRAERVPTSPPMNKEGRTLDEAAPTTGNSQALGNAYMRSARETAARQREVRRVNAGLLRVHREMEELALAAEALSTDLPDDVSAMRPAWATLSAVADRLPSEDVIALMLEEAEEEQRRCALLAVGKAPEGDAAEGAFTAVARDPYASLRAALATARGRAETLLESMASVGEERPLVTPEEGQ